MASKTSLQWLTFCLTFLATLAGGPLRAEDQPSVKSSLPVTVTQVNALAADLASDSRAARAKAEAALIALGPEALELLPHPESTRDPQTRESLTRIARAIEAAEAAIALEARTVTVEGISTRRAWVEQTSAATGNAIHIDTVPAQWLDTITKPPRPDPMTFWEVIRWLEADRTVRLEIDRVARLRPHDAASLVAPQPIAESRSGPFRVQCVECQSRPLSSGGHLVRVRLNLACEPRLRPLFLVSAIDRWQVTTKSVGLVPFTAGASRELPGGAGPIEVAWDFSVPPAGPLPTTVDIEGDLSLTLATQSAMVDFRDLNGPYPITRRRGQARVSLHRVRTTPEATTFRIAIALGDRNGLFESYRAALMAPELVLISQTGASPVTATTTDLVQEEPDGIVVESQFPGISLTDTSRLEARLPTAITTQAVPFVLLDVPVEKASVE